jgi:chloramphenicol O-acetyltransferase type A
MSTYLDLESWPRRPHFDFFRSYESPFWDVCTNVDVTALAARCRGENGPSFAPAAIYFSLRAANAVENLRYRLRGDRVLVHERIHGSSTILRPNETFGFAYFDFLDRYPDFEKAARREIEAVKTGATLDEAGGGRDDLIYYSVLPWIHFTSFQHARRRDPEDSVPRIVFGRHRAYGERLLMPVSLSLHHALADGLHAGRFFEYFERELAALEGL